MSTFVSEGNPVLLQALTTFEGRGLESPLALGLSYTVPSERTAGMFYFRAGSTVSGMVNISVMRDGKIDHEYIAQHTSGWEQLAETVREYTMDAVSQVTGLSIAEIEQAAALFGRSERTLSLWSMGVNQSSNGVA